MITSSAPKTGSDREKAAHPRHLSVQKIGQKWGVEFDFTLAAPSFVIPAGAAENSRFLADYVEEICLLFFETEACLNYTDFDLPPNLAELPISWQVHLPLDLPWDKGMDVTWTKLGGLFKKTAYLSPRYWVLHPPEKAGLLTELAGRLEQVGIKTRDILLENVEEADLGAVWNEARDNGYSTCLDLGHILAYGQHSILGLPGLWESVRMLHVYAPKDGGRHSSLANLDENGQELLRTMFDRFRGDTVTVEVFEEKGFFESVNLLAQWLADWSKKK